MAAWDFESALVPVTGAGSGIGLAVCRRLRMEGATPLLLDVDAAKISSALDEIYRGVEDRARYGGVTATANMPNMGTTSRKRAADERREQGDFANRRQL